MTNIVKELAVLMPLEKWKALYEIAGAVIEEAKRKEASKVTGFVPESANEAVTTEVSCSTEEVMEQESKEEKEVAKPMTRKEREAQEEIPAEITEDTLAGLSYNNLKKLASDMGISAKGSRVELVARIIAEQGQITVPAEEQFTEEEITEIEAEESEAVEEVENEVVTPEMEEAEEPEEEEEVEDEESLADMVTSALEEYSNEDIMDLLVSHEVKAPKGAKRQALIESVIKAVEDGIISFEEDEEEQEEVSPKEDLDEEIMTPARKEALEELRKEALETFEAGDLTREEMISYLNAVKEEEKTYAKVSDEDIVEEYVYQQGMLVDDDGIMHTDEGDPYEINGENYCCGKLLGYDETDKAFVCSVCGTTYEAE